VHRLLKLLEGRSHAATIGLNHTLAHRRLLRLGSKPCWLTITALKRVPHCLGCM